ncbi:MAG: sugar ABC transporter ATP-binding protein [Nitrospinae bacterium]|nr:sugar ABC transporter ATP-binding protein [Nitrospinota bacterium]
MSALLTMEGISKAFPGVQALSKVDFEVMPGEAHALIGENGAGKSTLIKILAGVHRRDAGTICFEGNDYRVANPHEALAMGVAVIYQELNLVQKLTVAQNIFLGHEPLRRAGFVANREMNARAGEILKELGISIDPRTPVQELGVAQKQMVEIAKALSRASRILVMDEPTAPLTQSEIEVLFRVIAGLKEQRLGIIYISHRLDEVFQIADRVTVLRDGERVHSSKVSATQIDKLVLAMVGRRLAEEEPPLEVPVDAPVVLEAEGLADGRVVRNISLTVRAGEVVGVAGLIGSGRSEFAHLLFGSESAADGEVRLVGETLSGGVPQRIAAGLGMVPEDRKLQGLVMQLLVKENSTLATLGKYTSGGFIRRPAHESRVREIIAELRIATRGPRQPVKALSGGNQQKVILSRWMDTGARALIFDEPTRGVDVGAKAEIYALIRELQRRGVAILMISSDLPEVLRISNRVIVIRNGRVAGELSREEATQEKVLRLMMGADVSGNGA